MTIYLGSDHAGFKLKEHIKKFLDKQKIKYKDLGNTKFQQHDDYPVYVGKDEDINERIDYYREASMQIIMEVYNLSMDLEKQLKEYRAYHI